MHGATDVNERLARAARSGELSALTQALEGGADAKCNDSAALQCAAVRGHVECVNLLIPVSDPLANDSSALRWTAERGHVECVRLLLPVSEPLAYGSYALQRAAEGGYAECVSLLIPVSDPMANDSEALRAAAINGHMECVALLLPVSEKLTEAAAEARGRGQAAVAGMIEAFIEAKALSGAIENPKESHRVMLSL